MESVLSTVISCSTPSVFPFHTALSLWSLLLQEFLVIKGRERSLCPWNDMHLFKNATILSKS